MERLREMQCKLIDMMVEELEHPETVCTKELYDVMDIVKDISECIYYCTITEAMKEGGAVESKYYSVPKSDSHSRKVLESGGPDHGHSGQANPGSGPAPAA